jgi:hypothetical protein
MIDNTTEKQLADLRKQIDKMLSNQLKLEGLIHVIGRHIYEKDTSSGGVTQFNRLAKPWEVET